MRGTGVQLRAHAPLRGNSMSRRIGGRGEHDTRPAPRLPPAAVRPQSPLAPSPSARGNCSPRRATRSAPRCGRTPEPLRRPARRRSRHRLPVWLPADVRADGWRRRRNVPFLLTPFLHLGDPLDPHDRTRRQYTSPAAGLAAEAGRPRVRADPERVAMLAALTRRAESVTAWCCKGWGWNRANAPAGTAATARAAWWRGGAIR